MRAVNLDVNDAAELAELLQFLLDWSAADRGRLGGVLCDFVGSRAYDIDQLRGDLNRFAFLLAGSDGQGLFGHESV